MTIEKTFRPVAIAFLIWSLMGIAAYLTQVTMDTAELARSDPYQAHMFEQMPHWAWAAYAIAVWSELAGSFALLARRAWATPLYLISLVAVLIQFSYAFVLTDLIAVKGLGAAVFPVVIIVIGLAQWLFAHAAGAKGLFR
ncbi:sugar transporter [Sphingobium subterraneum]|uniref:Sugar transporter n=1 Tax=Sphingobium subterraneum TaxID=627688 RepID=A0A841J3K0_9SPHN|nr:sugar transporter [Sphingobium subterraneum]MBB6123098.1 hypothetical protein [Sphingobium subterraneum]